MKFLTSHLDEQGVSKRGAGLNLARWFGVLGLMGVCGAAFGAACPDAAGDNGRNDIPSHVGFTSSCGLENASNTRYLNLDNEYFPDGRRFMAMFPDEANMPGDANPVKFVFSPTSGSSLSTINAIACVGAPSAVITGVGTTLGTVALDDGTSCALTASSVVGGSTFIYTSTLLRNGAVYSSINADFSILDTTDPRIHFIIRQLPSSSPTNADSLTWRVAFDENVNNVDATDFTRSGTTATIAVNTVDASTYDVTLSGGDLANLNATVTLGFAGGQDIVDTAGNTLTNTTPIVANDNTFVVENDTEIDVQRPAGTSIPDGGTDAQGNQEAGTQVTLTYTVSNTGSTALSVTNIASVNSVNVSVGSISPAFLNVAAGATATYTVKYTPTVAGAFSFDLDITNDDADEGNYDVVVSGTGIVSIYTVTPSAGPNGTVSPDTPQSVNHNSTTEFTLSADSGFTHENAVGGTCLYGSWNGAVYTTGVITDDCTANFSFQTAHAVGAAASAGGSATLQNSIVGDGDTVEFTVVADVNHNRTNAVGGTCPIGSWRRDNYTTGPVTGDCSVRFYFIHNTLCVENAGLVTINSDTFFNGEEIGCYTDVPIVFGPDNTIQDGAMVSLVSSASVQLISEFIVAPGAIFEVTIVPLQVE